MGWVRGFTACFFQGEITGYGRAHVPIRAGENMAFAQAQRSRRILREGYKAFLLDVNGVLRRTAGLRDALGSFDEEALEAPTEVKQRSREDRANSLKDQEA